MILSAAAECFHPHSLLPCVDLLFGPLAPSETAMRRIEAVM